MIILENFQDIKKVTKLIVTFLHKFIYFTFLLPNAKPKTVTKMNETNQTPIFFHIIIAFLYKPKICFFLA